MIKKMIIILSLFAFSQGFSQTLTIWHTENDPLTLAALDSIGHAFELENPGVTVKFLSVGWDDLYRKLVLALEGKDVPDLTQIEPFMGAYLYKKHLLEPMDDIINKLNLNDVFPSVRDLQMYDGKRYGIATALGISYYAFRKDFIKDTSNIQFPKTWSDFEKFINQDLGKHNDVSRVLLPSNDLHITLLFTELLASDGGSIFNDKGKLDLNNNKVIETLNFWKTLYNDIDVKYRSSSYKENFSHFARGNSFTLPCFFGRGILQIERDAPKEFRNPESFDFFPHIVGPSGDTAYATLDAEPWCILKGSQHQELAKKFLLFFYKTKNYLKFCESVPIHLTPIFESVAKGQYSEYPFVVKWKSYYDYLLTKLDKGEILPIFMARPQDRLNPELFKLEGSRVIAEMIRDVTQRNLSPETAIKNATIKAELLNQEFENKNTGITTFLIIIVILLIIVVAIYLIRKKKNARQ